MRWIAPFSITLIFAFTALAQVSQSSIPTSVYLSYEDASSIITAFNQGLPDELRKRPGPEQKAAWNAWEKKNDQSIRSRLAQGDEDTLVNFLLFGTSFTNQPRITFAQIQKADQVTAGLLTARLEDLVLGIESPKSNERLMFAKQVLVDKYGYKTAPADERNKLKIFLMNSLKRVFQENGKYKDILDAARRNDDQSTEFAERSTLFRGRGLSSDTVTQPNFALEEALRQLLGKGLIQANSIKRVAIVGPGLDFTDKQEGFDFYPLQTIQPFAVVDSLIKLGLAERKTFSLTTLDLSPRINLHVRNASAKARTGVPYMLYLAKEKAVSWKPEYATFWQTLGNRIGRESRAPANNASLADMRSVEVSPDVVSRLSAADVNIVLQNLPLAPQDKFDLIIATNILVYYDGFEQSLAAVNIAKMLSPNGVFLANNAIPETPSSALRSVSTTGVVYSSRPNDGDLIVAYKRR